jgi:hypothetical protein
MPKLEELESTSTKRGILIREDLEYTAQKIFTYATISLTAITVYASLTYLVIQQLKK